MKSHEGENMYTEVVLANDYERKKLRKQRKILTFYEVTECEARDIVEDILILTEEGADPITMIICSPGGESTAGMAIIRAMRYAQSKGIKIIGEVYGQAMSMAFFILQQCDERIMGEGDVLMAHGVTTWIPAADMKDVEAHTKLLHWFQAFIANKMAERSTAEGTEYKDPGFWHALLDSNTPVFFMSDEATAAGLIDEVV